MELNYRDLEWKDITSDLVKGEKHFSHLENRKHKIMHNSNYQAYTPDLAIIDQIHTILQTEEQQLKILILGATWCKTCARVKPILVKIQDRLDLANFQVFILEGAKLALANQSKDTWHSVSPPEFNNPKFHVTTIPTVFVFDNTNHCIAKFVKYPESGQSYEQAILSLLTS